MRLWFHRLVLPRDAKCLKEMTRGGRDRPPLLSMALEASLSSASKLISWCSASASVALTGGPLAAMTDYLTEVRPTGCNE